MEMKILDFIKETIGKSLAVVLIKLFDTVKCIVELVMAFHTTKEKKEIAKQQKEKEGKIDDVANNGTLDDLLDLGNGRL